MLSLNKLWPLKSRVFDQLVLGAFRDHSGHQSHRGDDWYAADDGPVAEMEDHLDAKAVALIGFGT